MESTIYFLYRIRNDPAIYLEGKASLSLLCALLRGYEIRKYDVDSRPYNEYEFIKFQQFVKEKYNAPQNQTWNETIAARYLSDEDAFYKFFDLLDEFISEEKRQMESLFKLLYKIKEKPVLHLGNRRNLALLRAYINGYLTRQWEIDENFRGTFSLNGFQEFVQKRYGIHAFSHSWDMIIDFYSVSDEEAFNTFYQLLDEFLGEEKELYQ